MTHKRRTRRLLRHR